jgi:heptosyltransferase-2
LARFAEVIEYQAERGWQVVLVGSREERGYVQQCLELVRPDKRPRVFNVAGLFPFAELPALLELCDALLTNDTGIMNFAFACKVRTVSMFGPNDPVRYHPGSHALSIYKSTYCSPCLHHLDAPPCDNEDPVCMTGITVEEVIVAIQTALSLPGQTVVNEETHACHGAFGPLGIMRHRN